MGFIATAKARAYLRSKSNGGLVGMSWFHERMMHLSG
jgi:hypothetical protein